MFKNILLTLYSVKKYLIVTILAHAESRVLGLGPGPHEVTLSGEEPAAAVVWWDAPDEEDPIPHGHDIVSKSVFYNMPFPNQY